VNLTLDEFLWLFVWTALFFGATVATGAFLLLFFHPKYYDPGPDLRGSSRLTAGCGVQLILLLIAAALWGMFFLLAASPFSFENFL
jgi:hypothetical protein